MISEQSETFEYPVGQRVIFFRERMAISTNKLANLAGISQSYLREIELGNKNPTVEVVFQICKALGITLKEFFSESSLVEYNDPVLKCISTLSPKQKAALLEFLKTL